MNQLVSQQKKIDDVRSLLARMKPQLSMALPRHLTPDRMIRVVLTDILRNPRLLECDLRSMAGAILQAAQLGLETGVLGLAYLVPFRNTRAGRIDCQLIPGYKGLVQLARRSGQISSIDARVVHARDKFKVKFGTHRSIEHDPFQEDGDPGSMIAVYAIAHFKDGGFSFEVMWKREVDRVRDQYSKAAGEGPWMTEPEAMAMKTVLRRLSKLLPMSVEMQTAVVLDEQAEAGIPQDLSALVDGEVQISGIEKPEPGPLDKLADSLENEKGDAWSPPAPTPAVVAPRTGNGDEPPKRPRGRAPTSPSPASAPPESVASSPSPLDALEGALTQIRLFTTSERLEEYVQGLYSPGRLRSKLIPQAQKLLDHAVGQKRDELAEKGEAPQP